MRQQPEKTWTHTCASIAIAVCQQCQYQGAVQVPMLSSPWHSFFVCHEFVQTFFQTEDAVLREVIQHFVPLLSHPHLDIFTEVLDFIR